MGLLIRESYGYKNIYSVSPPFPYQIYVLLRLKFGRSFCVFPHFTFWNTDRFFVKFDWSSCHRRPLKRHNFCIPCYEEQQNGGSKDLRGDSYTSDTYFKFLKFLPPKIKCASYLKTGFILVQCHHMTLWTSWSSLLGGHGSSVTDFWGWDAHEAQLRCPDDVRGDIGGWSARRALKLLATELLFF